MNILPATALADLIRLLCRTNIIDYDKADFLINKIQIWVFETEMQDRESKLKDFSEQTLDPSHVED
jgi:hypothetical protein